MAIALAALLAVWVAGLALPDLHVALLYLTPALLLAVAFATGRYPGARLLERLCALVAPPLRVIRQRPPARRPAAAAPSGGLLLAVGLAGRAPPGRES